jgi:aspartyl aminopeptidase
MVQKRKSQTTPSALLYKPANAWEGLNPAAEKDLEKKAGAYIDFLNTCKTERETISFIETHAVKHGFKPIATVFQGKALKPGTKVYWINKNRAIGLAVLGKRPIETGIHAIVAHHDVPHLDLKPIPLFQKHNLALLKTHYYGGIKKYQWCAIPLSLHVFAVTTTGKNLAFSIGEKPGDPVFTITDVAPHLSYKVQNDRKATEVFKGEELNVLVGSRPIAGKAAAKAKGKAGKGEDKPADLMKQRVLEYLHAHYGMTEEDLAWAEVSVVPALPVREIGFDRSLIGGFGHDDRSCVMAGLEAIFEVKTPENTAVALFFDKEEIGSAGASGAQSMMVSDFLNQIVEAAAGRTSYQLLRKVLSESFVLSGDTNAAVEPTFEGAWDLSNSGLIGNGVWICRYTGSGGKYGSSEADIEFIARVRALFQKQQIPYQFGEMGKVDEGGGGTVAKFLAQLNMHVLDLGLPVLGLHSPFEVLSKIDYYYTIKAYRAFMEEKL